LYIGQSYCIYKYVSIRTEVPLFAFVLSTKGFIVPNEKPKVVVIIDMVDPDNLACAHAAASPFLAFDLLAVMVTGRPVHPDPLAGTDEHDPLKSAMVHRLNTARTKGYLHRANFRDVPVYEEFIAPRTLVPHSVHLDEQLLDLRGDSDNWYAHPDGSLADIIKLLRGVEGPINLIVGGPLTLAAALMDDPIIGPKLGIITAQLGVMGDKTQTFGGGRRQFNVACDPTATHKVLMGYPGQVYMVPTDITKLKQLSFGHPNELFGLGINHELVEIYLEAYTLMQEQRAERVYVHDLAATFMMAQLLRPQIGTVFNPFKVLIDGVPHKEADRESWGEIDFGYGMCEDLAKAPDRFFAVSADPVLYRDLAATTLGSHRAVKYVEPGISINEYHYYVNMDPQGRTDDHPRCAQGIHIICMKCGGAITCQHGRAVQGHPCTRHGLLLKSMNPEHAKRDDWAYQLTGDRWMRADNNNIPFGACCESC
jgi:inosine-uridine nucleoside N-ribohydrolase